jgi:hypothetical protein
MIAFLKQILIFLHLNLIGFWKSCQEQIWDRHKSLPAVSNRAMSKKLVRHDLFSEVGEFLDSIPASMKRAATEEYKKFLHLKFVMEDTEIPAILSPSTLVDNVWHAHMLRPSTYNNFCQSVFGKLIDHDMAGSKSSDNEKLIRRRRTITAYKMVFNQEPNALLWEDDIMPNPSSCLILTPKLKPIGKGPKSILFKNSIGKSFYLVLKATETMEDLKRKIQSHERIAIDLQIISFGDRSLSRTCPHCKTADKRSLGEFEEFRTVFGPEKLIMPSEDKEMVEFHVGTIPRGNFVKSEGSKLSHVTIKALTGKSINISAKVNQSKKLVRFSFRNYVPSMNIFVGPKLKIC